MQNAGILWQNKVAERTRSWPNITSWISNQLLRKGAWQSDCLSGHTIRKPEIHGDRSNRRNCHRPDRLAANRSTTCQLAARSSSDFAAFAMAASAAGPTIQQLDTDAVALLLPRLANKRVQRAIAEEMYSRSVVMRNLMGALKKADFDALCAFSPTLTTQQIESEDGSWTPAAVQLFTAIEQAIGKTHVVMLGKLRCRASNAGEIDQLVAMSRFLPGGLTLSGLDMHDVMKRIHSTSNTTSVADTPWLNIMADQSTPCWRVPGMGHRVDQALKDYDRQVHDAAAAIAGAPWATRATRWWRRERFGSVRSGRRACWRIGLEAFERFYGQSESRPAPRSLAVLLLLWLDLLFSGCFGSEGRRRRRRSGRSI